MYEAAQTLAKWDRQYGKVMPIGVSVNLSPIQMARDDVPSVVEEALRYSGVSGRRLTVELTESAIIADPDKARQVLAALKGLERSEEHTSELQSLMRSSYAVFCLKKKK